MIPVDRTALDGFAVFAELRKDENRVRFPRAGNGAMYRMVFRYRKNETDVAPFASGVGVTRTFHLVDKTGKQLQQIKPGDTVPRGSFIAATVNVNRHGNRQMNYLLVESAKPSGCEIVPTTDKRFIQSSTQYVLREDKTHAVLYHHEHTGSRV